MIISHGLCETNQNCTYFMTSKNPVEREHKLFSTAVLCIAIFVIKDAQHECIVPLFMLAVIKYSFTDFTLFYTCQIETAYV